MTHSWRKGLQMPICAPFMQPKINHLNVCTVSTNEIITQLRAMDWIVIICKYAYEYIGIFEWLLQFDAFSYCIRLVLRINRTKHGSTSMFFFKFNVANIVCHNMQPMRCKLVAHSFIFRVKCRPKTLKLPITCYYLNVLNRPFFFSLSFSSRLRIFFEPDT